MIEENNIGRSVQPPAATGPIPIPSPTVVVSSDNKLPAWFIALFAVVVMAFVAVNYLLLSALRPPKEEEISSNPPSPTLVISLKEETVPNYGIGDSDEIRILESEIGATNISSIKEGLGLLDKKLETSPW